MSKYDWALHTLVAEWMISGCSYGACNKSLYISVMLQIWCMQYVVCNISSTIITHAQLTWIGVMVMSVVIYMNRLYSCKGHWVSTLANLNCQIIHWVINLLWFTCISFCRILLLASAVHVDQDGLEPTARQTSMSVSPIPAWMVEPVQWVNEATLLINTIVDYTQFFFVWNWLIITEAVSRLDCDV